MSSADLVIRNALIVDGSGSPGFQGDVAVGSGEILAIGRFEGMKSPGNLLTPARRLARNGWRKIEPRDAAHASGRRVQGRCYCNGRAQECRET
jgi:hypothetical protein